MLRVEKLRIAPLPALTFSVANGECLAIEGPSGSGKTRLLRAIADLEISDGHVFLDGVGRDEMPATQWRRRVRYVATEPAWWTDTAAEAFAAAGSEGQRALPALLAALGLEKRLLDATVADLSTGERQRLALARALLDNADVLLLDEPTAALDAGSQSRVETLVQRQLAAGRTVLLASHDIAQIERLSHARLQLAPAPVIETIAPPQRGHMLRSESR